MYISDILEKVLDTGTLYSANNVISVSSDNNVNIEYTITGRTRIRDYDSEQDMEDIRYLGSSGGTATSTRSLTFEIARYEYDYTREYTEDFMCETVILKIAGQTVFEKSDTNIDITSRRGLLNGKTFTVSGLTYNITFR